MTFYMSNVEQLKRKLSCIAGARSVELVNTFQVGRMWGGSIPKYKLKEIQRIQNRESDKSLKIKFKN